MLTFLKYLLEVVAGNPNHDPKSGEFTRKLIGGNAPHEIHKMDLDGTLEKHLPEVKQLQGVEQSPIHHPEGDVYKHTMKMMHLLKKNPSPELAWATLLHDIGKPGTHKEAGGRHTFHGHEQTGVPISSNILDRHGIGGEKKQHILDLVANHMKSHVATQMRPAKLEKFISMPKFEDHLELHRVDALGSSGDLSNYNFMKAKLEAKKAKEEGGTK